MLPPKKFNCRLAVVLCFVCFGVRYCKATPGLSFATEPETDLIQNGTIRFNCEPQAELEGLVSVEWFRNDRKLERNSPNVKKMVSAGRMHVLETREKERAAYRCAISLEASPLKLISQKAESIPTTIELFDSSESKRHIQVAEGSTAVIPCGPLPRSEPKAQTVIVFRGKRINLDGSDKRFQRMPSGNIYVYKARPTDSGEYECIAENPLTKVERRAPFKVYLIVRPKNKENELRANATIVHSSGKRIEAVVGTNVTLECIGDGFPQPKIDWQRVGSYLPEGHSEGNGTLTMNFVKAKDSGTYECSASNFVSDSSRTQLVILDPPRLKEPERMVHEVPDGSKVTLECEVIRGEPKPNVTWLFNGELLRTQSQRNIFVTDKEVHITAVRLEHWGHYQCFAENVLGATHIQYLVRVKSNREHSHLPSNQVTQSKSKEVRHPAPSKPSIEQVSDNAVVVSWTLSESSFPVLFFKVQYEAQEEKWQTADEDIPASQRSFKIDGLLHRKYRFRVSVVFVDQFHRTGKVAKFKLVAASIPSVNNTGHESPIRPITAVPIVTLSQAGPTSLLAKWTMPENNHDGFTIKYRRTDTTGEWLMKSVPKKIMEYTIEHLSPAQHYEVKVAAFNSYKEGNYSNLAVCRTRDPETPDILEADHSDNGIEHTNTVEQEQYRPAAVGKQHLIIIAATAITFGLMSLFFIACLIFCGRRLAGDCDSKQQERIRRQREVHAYVNDANSNFTPSISTVDLENSVPKLATGDGDDDSSNSDGEESSSGTESMHSVSHEEVPRSEKEYALKILTQLYTTNGHIVNINNNFNASTCVQSVL